MTSTRLKSELDHLVGVLGRVGGVDFGRFSSRALLACAARRQEELGVRDLVAYTIALERRDDGHTDENAGGYSCEYTQFLEELLSAIGDEPSQTSRREPNVNPRRKPAVHVLGARECEVLQLLADGYTSPRISGRLGITTRTVETHRRNIMRKLNLHGIAELTKYAVREGLATLED